ncbi:MAG: iron ABC transporter permease [Deltaproteobacteria bacterium]|jgi:iron complex transport system permease protein|nr:iron ABC transporter permease [Deltaproteobacteria bacterium]
MQRTYIFFCFVLLCGMLAAASPFWGMSVISPASIWTTGHPDAEVFWRLRLPRTLAAFLAGAGLSISGMVFQALLRNPLATPFTRGGSSGAALGASVYFRLGAFLPFFGSAGSLGAALSGGLLSMLLVYLITRARGGFSTLTMLLAGVIINFFFSSLVMFTQYLSDAKDSLRIMHWLMGSLAGLEVFRIADLACAVIAGALVIRHFSVEIDLLAAGEELAASRGVRTNRTKVALFATASIIVGTVVSLTGPIGFVGMIIPHMCRVWLGWSHRKLLPAAFFLGGCFLVVCDVFSRSILAPAEVPIGIITALIGGPFFLWVLFTSCRHGEVF